MGDKDGGYNPYEHREIEHPLSNCGAWLNLVKSIVGSGILALPLAYSYTGMISAIIFTLFSTIVITYGMHQLIWSMTQASKRSQVPYLPYAKALEVCFEVGPPCFRKLSKFGRYMVIIGLIFSYFGTLVVYTSFVGVSIQQICAYYGIQLEHWVVMGVVGLCFWPLFLVRHLKYLVPTSTVALVLIYLSFVFILYYIFQDLPPLSSVILFETYERYPLFFGIMIFSATSVGGVIAIESKMKHPEIYLGWHGMVNQVALFALFTNLLFGIIGYWRYGLEIADIITLNLPVDEIVAQLAKMCFAISIYFTYPINGYVIIDTIMREFINPKEPKHPHMIEYGFRTGFVVIATLAAMLVPNVGPLLSFVGCLTKTYLTIIFPPIMDLCILYDVGYGKIKWKLIRDIIIIILGIVFMFYGSYRAMVVIIELQTNEKSSYDPHDD